MNAFFHIDKMTFELDQLRSWADSSQDTPIDAKIKHLFKEIQSGKENTIDCTIFKGVKSFLREANEKSQTNQAFLIKLLNAAPHWAGQWKRGLEQIIENIKFSNIIVIETPPIESGKISIPDSIKNVLLTKLNSIVDFEESIVNLLRSLYREEFLSIESIYATFDEPTRLLFVRAKEPPLSIGNQKFVAFCKELYSFSKDKEKERFMEFIEEGADLKVLKNYLNKSEKERLLQTFNQWDFTDPLMELLNLGFPAIVLTRKHRILSLERLNDEALKRTVTPDFLDFLKTDFSGHAGEIFRKTIARKDCYQVGQTLIRSALDTHHYSLLDAIFSSLSKDEVTKFVGTILDHLKTEEDPLVGDIITKYHPEFVPRFVSKDLLMTAISESRGWFVRWSLESGIALNQGEVNYLLSMALKGYNLEIIQSIYDYAAKNKFKVARAFESFLREKFSQEKDAQFNYLLGYFMNSSFTRAMKIIDVLPPLSVYLPRIQELVSVMVRFPAKYRELINFDKHISVGGSERTPITDDDYIKKSREYAEANIKFIDVIVPKLHTLKHKDLLDLVAQERYDRDKTAKNPHFLQDRFGPKNNFLKPGQEVFTTEIHTRYRHSLRHFSQIAFDLKGRKNTALYPSIKIVGGEPNIHYVYRNKKISEPITTLRSFGYFDLRWEHPISRTVEELEPEVESLHQELLDKNLSNPENREIFNEKMARYYYLISTLCEKGRGTPHNAMMILNIFYAYHKLPPPIPLLEHFFLDNTMLMLPIEEVIENWENYFEQPLKTPSDQIREPLEKKQSEGLWGYLPAFLRPKEGLN